MYICPKCNAECKPRMINHSRVYGCSGGKDQRNKEAIRCIFRLKDVD